MCKKCALFDIFRVFTCFFATIEILMPLSGIEIREFLKNMCNTCKTLVHSVTQCKIVCT